MPLSHGKSEKSFKKNVKTEYEEGKPLKQSLAIAYALKKKAAKKMAGGGMMEALLGSDEIGLDPQEQPTPETDPAHKEYGVKGNLRADEGDTSGKPQQVTGAFAEGGEAMDKSKMTRRQRAMMMAMGGMAAMTEDDRDLNQHGAMEEGDTGEDRMDTPHPMDAHAVENQSDEEDMVGRIMKQRQQKFAVGGEVGKEDDEPMADGEDAVYDDLDLDAPDTKDADYTGANSGDEIGNEQEDMGRKDIVARIMKSRKLKGKMPNPA